MKKFSYIFPFIYVLIFFLILFLIFFIKYFSLKKEKEGFFEEKYFNNNKKTIILLGDSILNNRSYVAPGDSVEELLKKRTTDTIYNFAQDDATIQNVVQQLNQIPEHLNNHNTTIFLSLGGNDIIHYFIKNNNHDLNLQNNSVLQSIFIKYEIVVHMIRKKMNKSRLFLLDIYYPTNNSFQMYKPILQEWNRLLEKIYNINNNNNHILKISQDLNQHEDFTDNIEPSKIGSEKIANLILQSIA
jgi:lysophospholipase L1-like esterase